MLCPVELRVRIAAHRQYLDSQADVQAGRARGAKMRRPAPVTQGDRHGPQTSLGPAQLAVGATALAVTENVLLALLPSVVTAAMHTTMIRASMTAYSTAVGPSSRFRNRTSEEIMIDFIPNSLI